MSVFRYLAQDHKGDASGGVLDAADESEAISTLQRQGLVVLSITAEVEAESRSPLRWSSVSGRDLIFFSGQLATLVEGGIPLMRTLSLLGQRTRSPLLRQAVQQLARDLARGLSLHKAMERHPAVFDELWIALVQAGELGGQLPRALRQIRDFTAAQEELRSKVVTALAYPAILFIISMGVLAFFIIKIVPTFADIFRSFGLSLPPLTLAIVTISQVVVHHFGKIILAAVSVVFAYKLAVLTRFGQMIRSRVELSLPVFGDFVQNILLERLLSTLSTLISSGVSILSALSVLQRAFSRNLVFHDALEQVRLGVASGKTISKSMKETTVFEPLVTDMVWMGEESGRLPDVLETLADFYREQIDQFIRRFSAVIDPIMVVCIGGVVGVIVIAVFMPIFQLSQVGR
ncbi:MAG: type II secretion system F family protein [Elusimicrobiota bacterium]